MRELSTHRPGTPSRSRPCLWIRHKRKTHAKWYSIQHYWSIDPRPTLGDDGLPTAAVGNSVHAASALCKRRGMAGMGSAPLLGLDARRARSLGTGVRSAAEEFDIGNRAAGLVSILRRRGLRALWQQGGINLGGFGRRAQ